MAQLDDTWLRVVWQRCAFVFISRWQWWDLCQLAATLGLLAGAWALATPRERKLIGAMGLATLAGLAAALVGTDLFHDVLIANLQPWRVLWLATVLANGFLAIIVLRSPADWVSRKLLVVAATVGLASNFLIALILVAPALVLVACTVLGMELVKRAPLEALTRIFAYVATALSVGLAVVVAAMESPREPHFVVLTLGACLAASAVFLLVCLQRGRSGVVLAVAAAVVLAGSLGIADQREPWRKYVFTPGASADLGAFVSGAGSVYWEGDPGNQLLWFKLRQPSYFSCVQGAGSMFFRQTALEFARRGDGLSFLKTRTFSPQSTDQCPGRWLVDPWGANTASQLAAACRALPDLDTIILNRPVPGIAARSWHAPVAQTYAEPDGTTSKVSTFYRYPCAPLRRSSRDVPVTGVRSLTARLAANLSPSPDLRGARPMIWLALAVAVAICALLALWTGALHGYGDTDDATRLVIVRDLVAGRGWYDQSIPRLHPPQGTWLHWSRLLDGGIAGLILAFRQIAPPAAAEYWARYAWPLLWVFPAVAAALAIARNLGGRSAPFLTALLLLIHLQLYRQFHPGRIDHHDIQITMTVVALACALATRNRTRWAALAGAAAALGLAIGLEAMPLLAVIGAGYGLALARDRNAGGPAVAYGLVLAASTAALFMIETPPWRWSMAFCDEIAPNLVAGVAVAGLGLALAGALAPRAPSWGRIGLIAATALAGGGVYLALDPQCLHGPFAAMDPAVRPFWFDRIQEVQPLPKMLGLENRAALTAIAVLVMSLASRRGLSSSPAGGARRARPRLWWRLP